jgi:3,4-dihydroxy-2-butanone 4-phosphate synthase
VSDLVRKAEKSLILIDNYIDDTVFTILNKRKKGVSCYCYTKNISKNLQLDLQKHNEQYETIKILEFKNSHDRFLVIDKKELYHLGASLKDLGKKWFGFSKMELSAFNLLDELQPGG